MKLTIESAYGPKWESFSNDSILLNVKFVGFEEHLPFTATPSDTEAHGVGLFNRAVAGEFGPIAPFVPPVITPEQFLQGIISVVQKRLDDFAKTRNYDNILSACTYATSSVPKFAAEGQRAVRERDSTWTALYAIPEKVAAGTIPAPQSYVDIEPHLPVLSWD